MSWQEQINIITPGCNTSRTHTRVRIFMIPKSKSEISEHKNEKKNI